MDGLGCYAAAAELNRNPTWWLRDDQGQVIYNNAKDCPRLDPTVADAVEWWTNIPFSRPNSAELIDGSLADGADYRSYPNISAERNLELWNAKKKMIGVLQEKFTALNGGVVFANGISEYGAPPADLSVLNHSRGIQNEHFAAFEQVSSTNGSIIKDKVR